MSFTATNGSTLKDVEFFDAMSDNYTISICPVDCPEDTSISWNGNYLNKCEYSFNMHQRSAIGMGSGQNFAGGLLNGGAQYLDYNGSGLEQGILVRGGVNCTDGLTDYSIYWSRASDHSYKTSFPGSSSFELVTNLATKKSLYIGDYDGTYIGADFQQGINMSFAIVAAINNYLPDRPEANDSCPGVIYNITIDRVQTLFNGVFKSVAFNFANNSMLYIPSSLRPLRNYIEDVFPLRRMLMKIMV